MTGLAPAGDGFFDEPGFGVMLNQVPPSAEITCRFRPKSGAGLLRFLQ
jgi:hypothetical protein